MILSHKPPSVSGVIGWLDLKLMNIKNQPEQPEAQNAATTLLESLLSESCVMDSISNRIDKMSRKIAQYDKNS